MRYLKPLLVVGALGVVILTETPARAVIVFRDPGRNLAAPTGPLTDTGWQYQGQFGAFLGTPIGPRHFITANHISDPGTFLYKDGPSATLDAYENTLVGVQNDLAIFMLDAGEPSFTQFAPLYRGSDEVGKNLIAFGRGVVRGNEVLQPATTGTRQGWAWGAQDGQQSWGTNQVTSITTIDAPGITGDVLSFTFDSNGNPDEGALSLFDSGGAIFIQDPADLVWKLAGINSAVDGDYSYDAGGPYFSASMFDQRGFFVGSAGNHEGPITGSNPVPGSSYATRISSNITFIDQTAGIPEPGSAALLGIGFLTLAARRSRRVKSPK